MSSTPSRRVVKVIAVIFSSTVAALAPAQPVPALPSVAESVVVTANATPTEAADVASSVTVIGRDQIEASHLTSVLEVLRQVPGLEIVQAGGPGRAASVMLRGAASSHTLVLIDGVRVNSPATGGYDLADLRTDQVERERAIIEAQRAAQPWPPPEPGMARPSAHGAGAPGDEGAVEPDVELVALHDRELRPADGIPVRAGRVGRRLDGGVVLVQRPEPDPADRNTGIRACRSPPVCRVRSQSPGHQFRERKRIPRSQIFKPARGLLCCTR